MSDFKRVRIGTKYRYNPVGLDRCNPPCGVTEGLLHTGDIVQVVNKYGCPRANVMGHCYIETLQGDFLGMVMTNSLERLEKSNSQ